MTGIAFLILVLIAGFLAVRLWPDDRDRWHVDPAEKDDARRSEVRMVGLDAPRFPTEAAHVLTVIKDIARREPRTRLLDGSVEEGMITFVSHSVLGFRDYITFKAVDEVGQSKLAVLSRPRLDLPDRGTNAARLDRWLLEAKQTLER